MSTAHETAAAALEAAATALRAVAAEEGNFKVGDTIDVSKLNDLPVGLVFKDRDNDRWRVTGPGLYVWDSSSEAATLSPSNYQPLTVTAVPAPAAPEAPKALTLSDFIIGDRVKAVGVSVWGSNCDGKVGTVRRFNHTENEVVVKFDHTDGDKCYRPSRLTKVEASPVNPDVKVGDTVRITDSINSYRGHLGRTGVLTNVEVVATHVSKTGLRYTVDGVYAGTVEKIAAAPVPKRIDFAAGRVKVLAEQSYSKDGAFLRLGETGTFSSVVAAHLTKQQTRDLIATLQAVVDAPSVAPW